jgi:mersacidin/lichenicidin family type 2 lantibiotic
MSKVNIIRAWKDEAYRMSLSAEERAALPANPAGSIELDDVQLDGVAGGTDGNGGCGTGGGTGTGTGHCTKRLA